ncbi:DNA internalization-related competence protein ComEC/Rec2 [Thermovenabulum sp.]|uniref:DNA internalization-related competence protein ComEC/Rec2 n=1 Tax=Thermovenabulum sp. TaxID=3100335 RepID=UPI003C7CCD3E
MNRYFLNVTIATITGYLTAYFLPDAGRFFYYFATIFILISLFLLFYYLNSRKYNQIILIAAIFLLSLLYFHFYELKMQNDFINYNGQELELIGYIKDFPEIKNEEVIYSINTLYIKKDNTYKRIKGIIRLKTVDNKNIFNYGDVLRFKGKIRIPKERTNPGSVDYKAVMLQKGIFATLFSREIEKIGEYNEGLLRTYIYKVAYNLREHYRKVLQNNLDLKFSSLMMSVIFGIKSNVDSELLKEMGEGGIIHVLAASGLNVGIIYTAFYSLLNFFKIKSSIKACISLFIVFIYALAANFSPPVFRAFIMLLIIVLGNIINRKSDPLNNLSFAAFLVLIFNPLLLFSISFQFSFLATLGLILFYGYFKRMFSFLPDFLNATFSTTLSAQILLIPFLIYYFHYLSLASIFTNIIIVPIISFCLIIGLISGINIFPIFNSFLLKLSGLLLKYSLMFNSIVIKFPYAVVPVEDKGLLPLILYYLIIAMLFDFPKKMLSKGNYNVDYYRKFKITTLIFSIILIIFVYFQKGPLEVTFLDVGQGDSCIIKTEDNRAFIIDGGGTPRYLTGDFDTGEDILDPFLKSKGLNNIEAVIISHFDDDHAKGLLYILKNYKVNYLLYGVKSSAMLYDEIMKIALKKNIKVMSIAEGDEFKYRNIKFEVLNPLKKYDFKDENDASIVLKMDYKGFKILFTGDLSVEGEKLLLQQKADLKANVLKVGHHGSKTSSSQEFVKAVSPQFAVISVGENNFGHPSEDVLNLLKKQKISILRTDEYGAITFKIFDNRVHIGTMRDE